LEPNDEKTNTIQMLINAGIDVNQKYSGGRSALDCACLNDDPEVDVIKVLLEAGADPKKINPKLVLLDQLHPYFISIQLFMKSLTPE
jgi:ankyrin repeat protein